MMERLTVIVANEVAQADRISAPFVVGERVAEIVDGIAGQVGQQGD